MSLVTVIVPAYNQAQFVAEAIPSALQQSYSQLEVIVVDDGSTDDTPKVVGQFRDERLRYLRQENRGLSAARNSGLRSGWGRYISFLDADDLFLPDKVKDLIEVMLADESIGMVAGQAIPIDVGGQATGKIFDRPLPLEGADLLLGNPLHVGSVLIRRSWIDRVGLFDETLRSYEDWDMWLRLARAGCPMGWLPKPVSLYRFHPAQMTKDGGQMTRASLAVLDKVFTDPNLPEAWMARRELAYSNHYLRAAANSYRARDFKRAKEQLRRAVAGDPSLIADGGRPLADRFSAWTDYPKSADRLEFLDSIYRNLPESMKDLRLRYRAEAGSLAIRIARESEQRGDVRAMRRALWRALKHRPTWLTKRDVASMVVRSFLPSVGPPI